MNIVFCSKSTQVVERPHAVLNVPIKNCVSAYKPLARTGDVALQEGAEKCYPPDGQKERTRSDLALKFLSPMGT